MRNLLALSKKIPKQQSKPSAAAFQIISFISFSAPIQVGK
jgi:hypothetical protein